MILQNLFSSDCESLIACIKILPQKNNNFYLTCKKKYKNPPSVQ